MPSDCFAEKPEKSVRRLRNRYFGLQQLCGLEAPRLLG
jgi:hypothetical protein